MSGYFEWTGGAGDKQPHYVHGDEVLLAAAGLVRTVDRYEARILDAVEVG